MKPRKFRDPQPWRIWVDTGGTFTDCIAVDPDAQTHRIKVLSSSALRCPVTDILSDNACRLAAPWRVPDHFFRGYRFTVMGRGHRAQVLQFDAESSIIQLDKPVLKHLESGVTVELQSPEEAPTLAARLITGVRLDESLPSVEMRLATTRGTNALLERKGAQVALFITQGFGDLLEIGDQQRPDLFALDIQKPHPFYHTVIEVPERLNKDGSILESLDLEALNASISDCLDAGVRTAAVALMHGYLNPVHEQALAIVLKKRGFTHVSCASHLAPFIKILHRAETAVVDAYLNPIIQTYLDHVQSTIPSGRLHVMTSAGGLAQPDHYTSKDSLLSGPAGGVVGSALAGEKSGFSRILAFDMGGTSTDVARFDGDYDYIFEHRVGGARLVAPALAIESVAAGGGSICRTDGLELFVGPESGGADPGPACYGAGGPLTLTDVNLLLGRLDPGQFGIPIDAQASERMLKSTLQTLARTSGTAPQQEILLEGFLRIANERMANAIRNVSMRKGYDPKDYALVAFGGAGGQHACAIADLLNVKTVVSPMDAGLLSAFGLGHAVIERFAERQILQNLDEAKSMLSDWINILKNEALAALSHEGVSSARSQIRRILINMRFIGQESTVQVECDENSDLFDLFESRYRALFGHWPEDRSVEIESLRVVASSIQTAGSELSMNSSKPAVSELSHRKSFFEGQWQTVPEFQRHFMRSGDQVQGPAMVFEKHSATVIEPGWHGRMDDHGALILERVALANRLLKPTSTPQIVELELFTHRFISLVEEMGERLRRTAVSTNVKERLDFSCALLDPSGDLIVNAPHIPVHLGSMGLCVKSIKDKFDLKPGDVLATNHPRFGGSHLPDITVVTPVFSPDEQLLGFVANRAHHAEIGGTRPGSMPPTASCLAEEGVVILPVKIVEQGQPKWEHVRRILTDAPYPSRTVEENIADLKAAVAANHAGAEALIRMTDAYGVEIVWKQMDALKTRGESKIRSALNRLENGMYSASETLDDGSLISVAIEKQRDKARFDFTGSAGVHPGNLNATESIVHSAVIYVLRLLLDEPLPLNEGLMHPITIILPHGMLNPNFPDDPFESPSIVGGNVETSQRIVDTLIKALGLAACSQGTMNNTLFGNSKFSYYETVCGGCGAGPNFDGAGAVHSHMTNTRITDPEVIEFRYPVRLRQFSVRRDSGGQGAHDGGDGVVREYEFLEPLSLSVLGQHRVLGPYGMNGGGKGKAAIQTLIRSSGEKIMLQSVDAIEVEPGDRLVLKTPGGGGFGKKGKP